MSVRNIFGNNIEAEKPKIESTIEMKPHEIKADNMRIIDPLDTKL